MMATIYISDETLRDYLYTLEVCKKELPSEAHPAHHRRLEDLIYKIEWKLRQEQN